MGYQESTTVIGYIGFDRFAECDEYNEDACYIADSREAAEAFMENSQMGTGEFRIGPVTMTDIMNDSGASLGELAMCGNSTDGMSLVEVNNLRRLPTARAYSGLA